MSSSRTAGRIESNGRPASQGTSRARFAPALRWSLLGGWLLMMPPLPIGTELPPLSEWSPVSTHESAEECESKAVEVRNAARGMLTGDPNASATRLAAAMGQLQVTCVEDESAEPPAKPEPPTATKPPSTE